MLFFIKLNYVPFYVKKKYLNYENESYKMDNISNISGFKFIYDLVTDFKFRV